MFRFAVHKRETGRLLDEHASHYVVPLRVTEEVVKEAAETGASTYILEDEGDAEVLRTD